MSGLFLSFEGIDGVGKSTQVEMLREHLTHLGRDVVVTREPGGTPVGRQLRSLLLEGSPDGAEIGPRAEALMFAADRAQHVHQIIRPALSRGSVVISDRYIDSSLAYQAGGRELTVGDVRTLSMWATDALLPARTYLLDLDPAGALERIGRAPDRMESAGARFLQRTRDEFLDLARADPERFVVLDARRSVEDLASEIRRDVDGLLDDASGVDA
ncbi:MAG: dTMP kinase [Bifidobacterium minimum]|jgi:dTMP kinase|nr:dTMP kinase [Bifidobacterium minimum]